MFPSAGAEYEFARKAFNEFVAFLVGWMMVLALFIAAAAVSLGFAQYLRHFVDVPIRLAAITLLLCLTGIIIIGIQRSIWLSVLLAVLQIGGLLIVIFAGLPHVGDRPLVEGSTVAGVLSASALVFFAFIGFDEVVTLSEETKDAARVIPRALLLALGISAALYVLVGIAAVSVIGAEELAASDTPLVAVIEHDVGSRASDIVAFLALAATTNTALLALTAASRNMWGMARSGSLPGIIATIGPRGHSPVVAALIGFVVAAAFASAGNLALVAAVTDFAVYVIFIAVNVALVILRLRAPEIPRTFRVPGAVGVVPLAPILGTIAVLVMLFYLEPRAWGLGLAGVAIGALVWLALNRVTSGRGPSAAT
jgi:APA family basic amino acid/polyamine antiporter